MFLLSNLGKEKAMPKQRNQLPLFNITSICPVCTEPIFKFRDAVKELNANHPQRGSVLVNAIISDQEWADHETWIDQQKAEYVDPKIITTHERKN